MTPIEKNITVTDTTGAVCAPTYRKRAQGLVKSGRAHWVNDYMIVLARSPETITEDGTMKNFINKPALGNKPITEQDIVQEMNLPDGSDYTTKDLLDSMNRIIENTEPLEEILNALIAIPVNESPHGGYDGQARAEAIRRIGEQREQNNRYALAIIERMYKGLHPEAYE